MTTPPETKRVATKSSRPLVRVLILSMLAVGALGCAQWVADPDLRRLSSAVEPGPLRVSTTDGRIFVLKHVSVANDTLIGTPLRRAGPRVQVPLDEVSTVERRPSPTRHEGGVLRGLVIIGLSVIGLVFGLTQGGPQ